MQRMRLQTGGKKADCEGDAHCGKRARQEQPRGKGQRGYEIGTVKAKKEDIVVAKITGIVLGVVAKAMGTSRAAPFVVLYSSSEQVS